MIVLFTVCLLPTIITSVILIIEQKVRQFSKAPFVKISKLSYFPFYIKKYRSYDFWKKSIKKNTSAVTN